MLYIFGQFKWLSILYPGFIYMHQINHSVAPAAILNRISGFRELMNLITPVSKNIIIILSLW